MLEAPWEEAWHRFSAVPAGILGLPTRLEVGAPADFCILRWKQGVTGPGALSELQTVVGGVAGAPRTATPT
jgi:hypothetical protein